MSKQVLARFGLSLQILSSTEIGHELFYELPEANAIIQFGFNDFENVYFPLGDVLKTYGISPVCPSDVERLSAAHRDAGDHL